MAEDEVQREIDQIDWTEEDDHLDGEDDDFSMSDLECVDEEVEEPSSTKHDRHKSSDRRHTSDRHHRPSSSTSTSIASRRTTVHPKRREVRRAEPFMKSSYKKGISDYDRKQICSLGEKRSDRHRSHRHRSPSPSSSKSPAVDVKTTEASPPVVSNSSLTSQLYDMAPTIDLDDFDNDDDDEDDFPNLSENCDADLLRKASEKVVPLVQSSIIAVEPVLTQVSIPDRSSAISTSRQAGSTSTSTSRSMKTTGRSSSTDRNRRDHRDKADRERIEKRTDRSTRRPSPPRARRRPSPPPRHDRKPSEKHRESRAMMEKNIREELQHRKRRLSPPTAKRDSPSAKRDSPPAKRDSLPSKRDSPPSKRDSLLPLPAKRKPLPLMDLDLTATKRHHEVKPPIASRIQLPPHATSNLQVVIRRSPPPTTSTSTRVLPPTTKQINDLIKRLDFVESRRNANNASPQKLPSKQSLNHKFRRIQQKKQRIR